MLLIDSRPKIADARAFWRAIWKTETLEDIGAFLEATQRGHLVLTEDMQRALFEQAARVREHEQHEHRIADARIPHNGYLGQFSLCLPPPRFTPESLFLPDGLMLGSLPKGCRVVSASVETHADDNGRSYWRDIVLWFVGPFDLEWPSENLLPRERHPLWAIASPTTVLPEPPSPTARHVGYCREGAGWHIYDDPEYQP